MGGQEEENLLPDRVFGGARKVAGALNDCAAGILDIAHRGEEKQSRDERIKSNLGGIVLKAGERLDLLIDICAGIEVPCSSGSYVIVNFNGVKEHQTSGSKIGVKNQIWTLSTGSLFIFSVDAIDLFSAAQGLSFILNEGNSHGSSNVGTAEVPAKDLYEWNGERVEYEFLKNKVVKGKLALRVRRASAYDIEFMRKFHLSVESEKRKSNDKPYRGKTFLGSIKSKYKKTEKSGSDGEKITKYLVRPTPDPKRPDDTIWLTKKEIVEEMMKESAAWIDMGTGSLGDIYLEVLQCENLPNLDVGVMGNKTDAFVSVVYEDCLAQTNVIDDCLSPCWLPWSNRAFVLHMTHTSSMLYVGVFDSDPRASDNDDLVGRVSIDLTNFRSGMEYILHYDIYPTAKLPRRTPRGGSVLLRIRLDLHSERNLLLSPLLTFRTPPVFQVNAKTKKDLAVITQTIEGKINTEEYSVAVLNGLLEEVIASLDIYYSIEDAFTCIFLWKGHTNAKIPVLNRSKMRVEWVKVKLPIHSSIAFLCGIKLVENLDLLPSFFFFSVGWMLLASMGVRRKHANPWLRVKSFKFLMQSLLYENPRTPFEPIEPGENSEAAEAEAKMWDARIKEALALAGTNAQDLLKEQKQYKEDQELIGDDGGGMSTKSRSITVDPRKTIGKVIFYPFQFWLAAVCDIIRALRNIVLWDEPYFSFWVTLACGVMSVCCLFVPLDLLFYWIVKAMVWTILGPWMKLVDIYVFSKDSTESEESKAKREQKEENERLQATAKAALKARISREKAAKRKCFKQYLFGDYTSAVQTMNVDRYIDVPLPKSSAVPYNPKDPDTNDTAECKLTCVPGHFVVGEMVPKVPGKGSKDLTKADE